MGGLATIPEIPKYPFFITLSIDHVNLGLQVCISIRNTRGRPINWLRLVSVYNRYRYRLIGIGICDIGIGIIGICIG